jgi:hypothetical protein
MDMREIKARQRELRAKQYQKRFLQTLNAHRVLGTPAITFLDDQDASGQWKRFDEFMHKIEEVRFQDWKEARTRILENIPKCHAWMVFENNWDVGAFVVPDEVLGTNLDVFYQLLGPDFYCMALDLSHGCAFDKDEYSCSLRIW